MRKLLFLAASKLETAAKQLKTSSISRSRIGRVLIDLLFLPSDIIKIGSQYRATFGTYPNIFRPKTFNEHLQRSKLFNRKAIYTDFADKIEVRKYVAERIGEKYLTNLIWTGTNLLEARSIALPSAFIIKSNNGSGTNIIVRDLANFDWDTAHHTTQGWLKHDHSISHAEWQYRWIKPKLLIEELLVGKDGKVPVDFKFWCFHGRVQLIQIDFDRHSNHSRSMHTRDFKTIPLQIVYPSYSGFIEKPACIDQMIELAEKLAGNENFIRVDFYDVGGPIFGELTLHHEAGLGKFNPEFCDLKIGSLYNNKTQPISLDTENSIFNLRVALLTTEYPTEMTFAGGLASYLRRVGQTLVQQGHTVEVFCLSHVDEVIDDDGITVHRVKENTHLSQKLSRMPILWRYAGYIDALIPSLQLALRLRRRHRMASFDIAQASNYCACGVVSAFFKTLPIVTRVSSYEPLWREGYQKQLTSSQKQVERLEIMQMRSSSAAYAPSRLIAETITKSEGIEVATIEPPFFAPQYLDNTDIAPDLGLPDEYAMFFGSIGRLKGCDRLLRILPNILIANPTLNFIFAGTIKKIDGVPFDEVAREKLVDFPGRVFVLPALKPEQLFPLVSRARIVVLPSRVDNLPNACMEAMSLGRVVIGTHGASFDQLIDHGQSGFLVSQDNNDELAETISTAWNLDDKERARIGENARIALLRMTPERAGKSLTDFFQNVIAQPNGGLNHTH